MTRKTRAKKNDTFTNGLVSELPPKIQNGLADALFGANFQGLLGPNFGTQLNQLDTIFQNNRWYLISNMRQVLSEIYVEHGLIQTLIDVPVDDAFRGGLTIKTKQVGEDDIHMLQTVIKREGDLRIAAQAQKWNRLFGGAGVLPILCQDPYLPLDIAAIQQGDPVEFRAVDMWELFWDAQNTEGYNAEAQAEQFEHYNYYSTQVHRTRVFDMRNRQAPSFVRPRLRGWGVSEVEPLVDALNQYLKSNNLVFEVLDEFKLDIYKFDGLSNTLIGKDGTSKVRARAQLANQGKNFQNAVVLDGKDDFDHKQLSFSGIAEMYAEFRMQIACAMRMPISKIFGVASSGFSSGEDDIENYNAMVEGRIREPMERDLLRMVEIRCQQLFGMVPQDLEIEWKPLRVLSSEQEENVKTQKYNRLSSALGLGAMQVKEFKEACNKDNLLGVPLDTSIDELTPATGGSDGEDGGGEDGDGEAKPGAGFPGKAPKSSLDAKSAKNALHNADWDESKHPRADDGKFGEGGGGTTKGKERGASKGASESGTIEFELKEPERVNSRTDTLAKIITGAPGMVGGRGDTGKPSAVPYKSPAKSTCNLVGYVAFGKASQKDQKMLNEHVQNSEILLSEMGIKLKTPIDFVCMNVASDKTTTAHYQNFKSANPRITIKSNRGMVAKSIVHEIGHAIDYAQANRAGFSAAAIHLGKTAPGGDGKPSAELQKLHGELKDLLIKSDYYTMAQPAFQKYLANPTEIFARSFEVYAHTKAKKLMSEGKLAKNFLDQFQPDLYKTKDERLVEAVQAQKTLQADFNALGRAWYAEKDPEKSAAIGKQRDEIKKKFEAIHVEVKKALEEGGGGKAIPEAKQKEYADKVEAVMTKILALDEIKNAINYVFGEK